MKTAQSTDRFEWVAWMADQIEVCCNNVEVKMMYEFLRQTQLSPEERFYLTRTLVLKENEVNGRKA